MFDDSGSVLILVAVTMPLIALWVVAYWDLARRTDLTASRKVAWAGVMFVLAYIGILAYAMSRPAIQPAGKTDRRTIAESSRKVGELENLVERHRAGEIDDEQFIEGKQRVLNG